jgi:hypothetical protein
MPIINKNWYLWIIYFFNLIHNIYFNAKQVWYPIKLPSRKPLTILDETAIYILKYNNKFIQSFANESGRLNANTDLIFYSKVEHSDTISQSTNTLEKLWRSRILFENTPRGNIVMFYDAYKMAFSYYSDSTSIAYNILNAVAMKYVLTYCCRDLFVDNEVMSDNESPLIQIHYVVESKPKTVNNKNSSVFMNDIRNANATFAKLKNYKTDSKTDSSNAAIEYNRNRFINLGKIYNFSFLNKPIINNPLNGFKTKLLDGVFKESELQSQVLSYKDYVKINSKTNDSIIVSDE